MTEDNTTKIGITYPASQIDDYRIPKFHVEQATTEEDWKEDLRTLFSELAEEAESIVEDFRKKHKPKSSSRKRKNPSSKRNKSSSSDDIPKERRLGNIAIKKGWTWDKFRKEFADEIEAKREELGADMVNEESAMMILAREKEFSLPIEDGGRFDPVEIEYGEKYAYVNLPYEWYRNHKDDFKQAMTEIDLWRKWDNENKLWILMGPRESPIYKQDRKNIEAVFEDFGLELQETAVRSAA